MYKDQCEEKKKVSKRPNFFDGGRDRFFFSGEGSENYSKFFNSMIGLYSVT